MRISYYPALFRFNAYPFAVINKSVPKVVPKGGSYAYWEFKPYRQPHQEIGGR